MFFCCCFAFQVSVKILFFRFPCRRRAEVFAAAAAEATAAAAAAVAAAATAAAAAAATAASAISQVSFAHGSILQ